MNPERIALIIAISIIIIGGLYFGYNYTFNKGYTQGYNLGILYTTQTGNLWEVNPNNQSELKPTNLNDYWQIKCQEFINSQVGK